jgi:hypothetical protein
MRAQDVHVGGELAQGFVEVVHLRENAAHHQDNKDVCRRVCELVVPRKRHLERDTERFDEHDRYRAGGGANGEVDERVLATVLGRNLVDHEDAEDDAEGAVEEKAYSHVCQFPFHVDSSLVSLDIPGWRARFRISSTDSTSLSGGACSTMMTDPIKHIAHPILPSKPSCSSKKYEPSTAPMSTESAPRGVTRIAGANAYAAKLKISPSTTACRQLHILLLRYVCVLTRRYARPPHRVL